MMTRSNTIWWTVASVLGATTLFVAGLKMRAATAAGGTRAVPTVHKTYPASDAVILNPERGFYRAVNIIRETDLKRIREGGNTLVYSNVRLDAARNGPIPEDLLKSVEAGLAVVRAAGLKAILRCAYNAGPYPNSQPDASKERVLEHIRQLRPLMRRNEDVIALFQAGFIGAWGEWHTSTNHLLDDPATPRDIVVALLDALPPSRMTQVRTPAAKQKMFGGPLTPEQAFTGIPAARVGHHNDCFLAGETDSGTYPPNEIEKWKEYVAQETRFVPMGGETCSYSPPRSDCASATAEMKRLHFSFINQDYQPRVVNSWTTGGCRGEMDRLMGYRLRLLDADVPETLRPGDRFRFRVRLHNDGWAAPFNPRSVYLVLAGDAGRYPLSLPVKDIRRWEADQDVAVDTTLSVPAEVRPGAYRLALWLPDASARLRMRPEYAIRLANEGVWEAETGLNVLAPVTVARGVVPK
jgi:Domain of unknown function (DUF4832)/Domain of unknown function (DUF4874)